MIGKRKVKLQIRIKYRKLIRILEMNDRMMKINSCDHPDILNTYYELKTKQTEIHARK